MTLTSKGPIRIGPGSNPPVEAKSAPPPAGSVAPDRFISISTRMEFDCIGIIGPAGCGKTHFSLTFPRPLVYNFDNKLPAGVENIPFWRDDFCRSIKPTQGLVNRRDALKVFLETQAKNYPNHTHILDSWTAIQEAFDIYTEFEKPRDTGKDAVFSFFRKKIEYSTLIISLLRGLPITSIINIHESPERNDEGQETGRIKPSMEGQFADRLPTKLTDYYRLVTYPIDVDVDTGAVIKDPSTGKPRELRGNYGRYLQVTPNRAFTPVLGQHKMEYIMSNRISFLPATYEDWKRFSGIKA